MTDRLILGLVTPSELLAIVLVIVTIYYAIQTRQTVQEMRRARGIAILPRLAVRMRVYGGGTGWPQIVNVGPGAAIGVDVRLVLEPGGHEVPWQGPVISPGESHELRPFDPKGAGQRLDNIQRIAASYEHIRLTGTFKDALGDVHEANDSFPVRAWWAAGTQAGERLPHDSGEETVGELQKLNEHVRDLTSELMRRR